MRFHLLLLLLALVASLPAQHRYTGCVTDKTDNPLIGASILLEGTTTGTVSDFGGCFDLICPDTTARLIIGYTGYETKTIVASAATTLDIRLEEGAAILEEVVVTGYAATHKRVVRSASSSARESGRESSLPPPSSAPPAPRLPEAAMDLVTVKAYGVPLIEMDASTAGVVADYVESSAGIANAPAAGQLTAGESNDFSKWELWQDISQEDLAEFRSVWGFYPDRRYTTQLTYKGGIPAADVKVSLQNKAGDLVWTARTDNLGRAELWAGINDPQFPTESLKLVAQTNGKTHAITAKASTFGQGINSFELLTACASPEAVDIAFVVDATGSMGDELRYLTSELGDVITRTREQLQTADLRTAAVFYRDSTDDYVTRHQAFTDQVDTTLAYFNQQYHGGGGDHPEAVDAALQTALDSLDWRSFATSRLLFLVLDAPPHNDPAIVARLQRLTKKAASAGIRLIPVVCSGMTKDGEYLLRSMALATNGTYVFLTDDSGIGGKHLAPTTDTYEVEKLNDLLVRLIVTFSKNSGCGSAVIAQQDQPTEQPKDALAFEAYPNPTSGPVNLKLPKGEGEIFVIDVTGKLLRRMMVNSRKTELDLTGLAAGTYLIRYVVGEDSGIRRVVLTAV